MLDSDDLNRRLFFPSKIQTAPPNGAIDIFVDVEDARLHLRWHRFETARATVLLFHGNGEVVADYDRLAPSYAQAGLELAVVDYRGYGASTGSPTLRTAMEDAHHVVQALARERPAQLIVMGRSLGSACAAEVYGSTQHGGVKGVIIESGFSDLHELVKRRELEPPRSFSEEETNVFDPLPKLRRGSLPLLVLHGEYDTLIAPSEGRALLEAAGGRDKRFVLIPGRGHNDISAGNGYWEALESFLL